MQKLWPPGLLFCGLRRLGESPVLELCIWESFRSLLGWLCSSVAAMESASEWLLASLHGDASIPQQFIQYAWAHLEDPVDVGFMNHTYTECIYLCFSVCILTCISISRLSDISRGLYLIILSNVILRPLRKVSLERRSFFLWSEHWMHACSLAFWSCPSDPGQSGFLMSTTQSILDLDWHSKGKYGPLCCLVELLGASPLMQLCSGIAERLLAAISEQTLACYVCTTSMQIWSSKLDNFC